MWGKGKKMMKVTITNESFKWVEKATAIIKIFLEQNVNINNNNKGKQIKKNSNSLSHSK